MTCWIVGDAFDAVVVDVCGADAVAWSGQAAAAGKHVLANVAVADSVEAAEEIIQASRDAAADVKIRFMPGRTLRYSAYGKTIKDSMSAGRLGEPGLLRIHCWESTPRTNGNSHQQNVVVQRMVRELDVAN